MGKRGLALIHKSANLMQFLWYYSTYGKDIEWDALCLPNGFKGLYMDEYCKNSGVFKSVFSGDTAYMDSSTLSQLKVAAQMFLYKIVGKREKYCKKIVNQYINVEDYDSIVVPTDLGIVSGAFIGLGKKINVVILEDGTADYILRENSNLFKDKLSINSLKGFIVAKMGYANTYATFPLKTTKYCDKFCSHPDLMKYTDYKSLNKLYDYSLTDMNLYKRIVEASFGNLDNYDFENIDIVVFSTCINSYVDDYEKYIKATEKYIDSLSGQILLKKHPRDIVEYEFEKSQRTTIMDASLPAEIILPYIIGKVVVFMDVSSIMLYSDNQYKVKCIYYDSLHNESVKNSQRNPYPDKEEFLKELESLKATDVEIIDL